MSALYTSEQPPSLYAIQFSAPSSKAVSINRGVYPPCFLRVIQHFGIVAEDIQRIQFYAIVPSGTEPGILDLFPDAGYLGSVRATPEVVKLTCVMAFWFFCVYKLHSCISVPPRAETSTRYPLSVLCTDSTRSVLRNRIQQHKAVITTSAAAFMVLLVLFMAFGV